jgi:hypothetical protein
MQPVTALSIFASSSRHRVASSLTAGGGVNGSGGRLRRLAGTGHMTREPERVCA